MQPIIWEYARDKQSGHSVLVAFDGKRFSRAFDVDEPKDGALPEMATEIEITTRFDSANFVTLQHLALEMLYTYVNSHPVVGLA